MNLDRSRADQLEYLDSRTLAGLTARRHCRTADGASSHPERLGGLPNAYITNVSSSMAAYVGDLSQAGTRAQCGGMTNVVAIRGFLVSCRNDAHGLLSPGWKMRVAGGILAVFLCALFAGQMSTVHRMNKTESAPAQAQFTTQTSTPKAPRVLVGVDDDGQPLTSSCGTCHANRPPELNLRAASSLTEFHQKLS